MWVIFQVLSYPRGTRKIEMLAFTYFSSKQTLAKRGTVSILIVVLMKLIKKGGQKGKREKDWGQKSNDEEDIKQKIEEQINIKR